MTQTRSLNVEAGPEGSNSRGHHNTRAPQSGVPEPSPHQSPWKSLKNPSHRGPSEVPGLEETGGQPPTRTTEPAACQRLLSPLPRRLLAVITLFRWDTVKARDPGIRAHTGTQMAGFRHTARSVSTPATHPARPAVQWGLPVPRHPPVREEGLVTSQGHMLTEQSTPSFPLCGQEAMARGPHPALSFFVNKAFWTMQMFQDICSFTENLCLPLCQDNTASSGAARDPVAARELKILTP